MAIPILGDIVKSVGDLVSEVIPDADKRAEIKLKFAELADRADQREHDAAMGQVEVNKIEAAHRSVWVAGWRPGVGWSCAAGIAWLYVIGPIVEFIARLCGWQGAMPDIDAGELSTLLLAMLGVAGLRTFDKVKGTADDTPLGKPKAITADMPILGQNAEKVRKKLKL